MGLSQLRHGLAAPGEIREASNDGKETYGAIRQGLLVIHAHEALDNRHCRYPPRASDIHPAVQSLNAASVQTGTQTLSPRSREPSARQTTPNGTAL
ncbi:hypothetical protein GCM10010219_52900 [Streptomyces netropsis]|nr:hypothetical protein GCM10010219_52900 [Streptomyces netropsis]